jgi:flagellar biosynthetic protein FliQ
MNADTVMKLAADALLISLKLSGPFLLTGLVVGVLISIVQAATQLQEFTLQFIPKILAVIVVLAFAGPWMMSSMIAYTQDLYRSIPQLVNGT